MAIKKAVEVKDTPKATGVAKEEQSGKDCIVLTNLSTYIVGDYLFKKGVAYAVPEEELSALLSYTDPVGRLVFDKAVAEEYVDYTGPKGKVSDDTGTAMTDADIVITHAPVATKAVAGEATSEEAETITI